MKLEIKHVRKGMNQSHGELMKSISKLSDALAGIGLADTTMKRSLVLQGPEYSWTRDSQTLQGYFSRCEIDLYVDDMNKLPLVYKELANFRQVSILDTDFKRHDEFSIRKGEYEKALQASRVKAEYMAQALQAKVGKVHSIQELGLEDGCYAAGESAGNLRSMSKAASAQNEAAAEYGSIKITALVAVEFDLDPAEGLMGR
jgi:uncharacterized protein YggE